MASFTMGFRNKLKIHNEGTLSTCYFKKHGETHQALPVDILVVFIDEKHGLMIVFINPPIFQAPGVATGIRGFSYGCPSGTYFYSS